MADAKDTTITTIMEHLLEQGPGGMADVFTSLFNIAMRQERMPPERDDDRLRHFNTVLGLRPYRVARALRLS